MGISKAVKTMNWRCQVPKKQAGFLGQRTIFLKQRWVKLSRFNVYIQTGLQRSHFPCSCKVIGGSWFRDSSQAAWKLSCVANPSSSHRGNTCNTLGHTRISYSLIFRFLLNPPLQLKRNKKQLKSIQYLNFQQLPRGKLSFLNSVKPSST